MKSRLNYGRKKVEVKVKELEKRGTKLYSLAPLPFLLWLFRMDAKTREIPSSAVLEAVTAKCAVPGTAAVSGVATASVSVKAVAGAGIKTLAAKIVAGVLAVSMIGGGAVLMFSSQDSREVVPTEQTDISNGTIVFAEEAAAETLEAPTASAEPVADAALDAYEQVITDFVAACATDSERWLSNAEIYRQQYSNLNTERLDNYHRYAGMAFYYAFVDLDENGIYELVIGEQNQIEPRHVIISIYSFDGSGAVEIIECGNNHIADICTDGRVILTEGTILDGTSYICAMSDDGIYPQIIAEHTYDLYAGTYTNGSETISSQEYYARYASGGYWTIEWNYLCG